MIKHLVFWKLAPEADGMSREENAARVGGAIMDLIDEIPEIVTIEVGTDINRSEAAWDVALYSAFETWDDLATYQAHPAHQEAAALVGRVTTERAVVDYEM